MTKKNWIVLVVVLALIVICVLMWRFGDVPVNQEPEGTTATSTLEDPGDVSTDLGEDTTSAIEAQLEGINLGDLESEFDQIDLDLEEL